MILLLLACTVCEPGRVCVLMGTGELGFNGDGLDALDSRLASPTSVRVDPDGRPVVVDYSNMRVRVLTQDGRLETLVGSGIHAYSEPGVAALQSPLENPVDAVWGPDGRLYVLAQHEGRVLVVEDGAIQLYAGSGELADLGDGGPALDAAMGYGGGLAFDDQGALYVSDTTFHRVRRVSVDGVIDTVLGTGEVGLGAPGWGPEVAVRSPERLVVQGSRLLVADTLNHRVLALDLDSLEVEVVAGSGVAGFSGDGGAAVEATLDGPVGVEVDADGGVLIADLENDRIRRVDADGSIETVVVGDGDARTSGDALSFPLRRPAGMAWSEGGLLIAERSGHRVLLWEPE